MFTPEGITVMVDEQAGTPRSIRRPQSRFRLVDLFLDAAFSFTGPAQVSFDDAPARGARTEEEARAGYGGWERVTIDGHSYLVEKRARPPRPDEGR
ncbi:hypothetical protein GTR02_05365 [Kineococcus sp. R8]|uniref:hypothetical protein n=1 Tax=Kineococcus siccus TaxID=2696567 RepID=UPI0014121E6A|nr:hypothetical protein [Kineococcus siccus]NAZ81239.1 hypothetical protein [Kineococcus siccus]